MKRFISLLFVICLTGCNQPPIPSRVDFQINQIDANIKVYTDEQQAMIDSEDILSYVMSNVGQFAKEEKSYPLPVNISWSIDSDSSRKPDRYEINISQKADMTNSFTYVSETNSIDTYNYQSNTKYYYQVSAIYKDKTFTSDIKDFTYPNISLRNIRVPGVINVRDLGDGVRMKSGLLYRTGQFNYDKDQYDALESAPTEEGKNVLLNQLGIKTEIDLRKTSEVVGITSSPLGDGVKYVSTPMEYGNKNIFTNENNVESIKTFFNELTNKDNYPIAFHCIRGTDRTGALAYVLKALCGFTREELYLDYYFSNFSKIGSPVLSSPFTNSSFYDAEIDECTGETLKDKTINYLIDKVGISLETINTVIGIIAL